VDALTSAEMWLGHEASLEFGDGDATVLKAEYDRVRTELDRAYTVMERMGELLQRQALAVNAALVGTLTRDELQAIQDETRAIAREMRGD
jgi:hypothetical protein